MILKRKEVRHFFVQATSNFILKNRLKDEKIDVELTF